MGNTIQIYMGDIRAFYAAKVKIILYSIMNKKTGHKFRPVHFFMLNKACTQAPEKKIDRKHNH